MEFLLNGTYQSGHIFVEKIMLYKVAMFQFHCCFWLTAEKSDFSNTKQSLSGNLVSTSLTHKSDTRQVCRKSWGFFHSSLHIHTNQFKMEIRVARYCLWG